MKLPEGYTLDKQTYYYGGTTGHNQWTVYTPEGKKIGTYDKRIDAICAAVVNHNETKRKG